MTVEWIIFIAAVIIVFLLIKAMLKIAIMTLKTAFQILIILIVLRVFFAIMPQAVFQQVQQLPQMLSEFLLMYQFVIPTN